MHRALCDGVQVNDARAWLFRVARNLWIDSRRDHQRFLVSDQKERLHTSPAFDPEQQALYRERVQFVAAEAGRLPQLERQCLRLKAHGLRYREIAFVLGIPMRAAVECVRRGVKTIRRRLAESESQHGSRRAAT